MQLPAGGVSIPVLALPSSSRGCTTAVSFIAAAAVLHECGKKKNKEGIRNKIKNPLFVIETHVKMKTGVATKRGMTEERGIRTECVILGK